MRTSRSASKGSSGSSSGRLFQSAAGKVSATSRIGGARSSQYVAKTKPVRTGSRIYAATQSLHHAQRLMRLQKKAPTGESLCNRASDISASFLHDLLAPMGKTLRYFGPRMVDQERLNHENTSALEADPLASSSKDDIDMAARQSPLTGWIPAQAASAGPQPPPAPPPVSFQPATLDSLSSVVDRHAINRPLQGRRPAGRYEQLRRHRELHDLGSSSASDSSPVPVAASSFLKNEARVLISSSDLSEKSAVENVLNGCGSQWCSQALFPVRLSPEKSTRGSRGLSLGSGRNQSMGTQLRIKSQLHLVKEQRGMSVNSQRTMSMYSAVSDGTSAQSVDQDVSLSPPPSRAEPAEVVDLFESTAEWIEVTFHQPVLLSCLVVKWGRHFAQQYTVLSQWHPEESKRESGSAPYWLPLVTPPTFSLPGERSRPGSGWCVVHVEQNGTGGTDMIRFGAGPVCTKAIRLRMTKPGNLIGAVSVTDCYYSICGLGAVPFRVPVGMGLRAEYFLSAPDPTFGFHNLAEASSMEPSRRDPLPSCRREGLTACNVDPNDGKFGPAPVADPQRRCHFASYTGWLRIDQYGVYEIGIKLQCSADPESCVEESVGTCSVWINLGHVTAVGEHGNQIRMDGSACTFSRPLHTGCHALAIQITLEDFPIPDLFITYKGPDTQNEVRPLPASVLAPPAMADASMTAIAITPGAAGGLSNFDPVCRDQAAPLLAYELDKFQVAVTPARPLARVFVSLCSEGIEGYNDEDSNENDPLPANTTSKAFPLFPNGTRLSVRVLAEDLRTELTYYFSVQCIDRDLSRDCFISELSVSTPSTLGGFCRRTFDIPQTGNYDVIKIPELPYMALTVSIFVRVPNKDATIYIAKGPLKHRLEQADNLGESGVTHQPISLHVGRNIFYIRVVSPDKRIVRNWTVDVKRSASSDATMKVVSIEPCGFRQYLPDKDDYRISEPVPFGCNAARVWVEANHADAKVYVGVDDPRCGAIKRGVHRFDHHCQVDGMRVPLRVAWNTIYVRVVAMDNTTSKTYAFHMARRPLSLLSGMVGLGMPLSFDSSIGSVPDGEHLKLPAMGAGPVWSLGTSIWDGLTTDNCMSQWVQMSFAAPLLIAGIRIHWSSTHAISPMFEIHVRGETPWELTSDAKGPLPRCMPALHRSMGASAKTPKGKRNTIKQQVTRSRWRIDHISQGVAEVLDLVDVQHFSIYETKDCGWRLFAHGVGDAPVALPAAVCAEEVRIKVVGFEDDDNALSAGGPRPIAIDGLELVPMQVSEVGLGFVGEFFLGSPERLSEGGRPDLAALEPSLDGSDMAAMSVRVPATIGAVPWAAQYSGLLDVREPGEYMFWVETNRFRQDQTLMWRLCIDGTILQPPDPKEVCKKVLKKKKTSQVGTRRLKHISSKESLHGENDSNESRESYTKSKRSSWSFEERSDSGLSEASEGSEHTRDSYSCRDSLAPTSPAGSSTYGTTPTARSHSMRIRSFSRSHSFMSSGCRSDRSGDSGDSTQDGVERMSSTASIRSTRSMRKHKGKDRERSVSSVKGQSKNKHKGLKRRWLTVNCIAAMSQGSYIPEGMQVSLLPGGHYVRLEVLAFADQPMPTAGISMCELGEDEEHTPQPLSPKSPRTAGKMSLARTAPRALASQADAANQAQTGGNAGIQVNLAYRGPDTNGHVIVVPPRCIAPIPEDESHCDWRSLVRPTLPLLVHSEVAESWSQAAVAMTAWLEDECFLQQVFDMSAHSIDHEDDWRGKCQLVAVYSNTQHGGSRLRGLRFQELEYCEERVPSSLLESVAALLQKKRFVGMASSTDQFYDFSSMKLVIQNALLVWYLDQEPQTTSQVNWKAAVCESPEAAAIDVVDWMAEIGLRRCQLLSLTLHPVRRAGTSNHRNVASSEQYEWLAFFYDEYDAVNMGCPEQLGAVQHQVWQTQNTWKWHFEMLKESAATAQTIVAYATTSTWVDGRSQCAQIALWQVPDVDLEIACSSSGHSSHGTQSDLDSQDAGEIEEIRDVDRVPDRLSPSGDCLTPTGDRLTPSGDRLTPLNEKGRSLSMFSRPTSPSPLHEDGASHGGVRRMSSRRSMVQSAMSGPLSSMSGRISRTSDLFFASDASLAGTSSRAQSPTPGTLGLRPLSAGSRGLKSPNPFRPHETPSTCLGDDDRCLSPADSARNCTVNFLQSKLYPESIRSVNAVRVACWALLQRDVYPVVLAKVIPGDPYAQCWCYAHECLAQLYWQVAYAVAERGAVDEFTPQ